MNTCITVSAALMVGALFALAPAQAQAPAAPTPQNLQAQIERMQSQINSLQSQVKQLQSKLRAASPSAVVGPGYPTSEFTMPNIQMPSFQSPDGQTLNGQVFGPRPFSNIPHCEITLLSQGSR